MVATVSLKKATVQDIQLELIRRTSFNAMNGKQVVESLQKHRDRWLAVYLDRPGLPNYSKPTHLQAMSLIKLRDLAHNYWNADTLYILTRTPKRAKDMAKLIEKEDWGGEVYVHEKQDEVDSALGVGGETYGLVTVWWD